MPVGCRLGINKINVQAYADDIILFFPTAGGLQQLLDRIVILVEQNDLLINADKTKIMVFRPGGKHIEVVYTYKYLGCVLSSDLCNVKDMERCRAAFNKSFGFLFRRFRSVDFEMLYSLFISFCTSFYGCELWLNRKKFSSSFKQVTDS